MKGLSNLANYTYKSIDKSISSKFLKHYWNFCMIFIPRWIAPNLITFIGLLCNVSAFLLISFHSLMNSQNGIPPWLCIYSAVSIWLYSTFDNLDGKQARRTNSSSPLGELFDHGCDSLNIFLGTWIQINSMGLFNSYDAFLMMILAFLGFFTSTWEHFHTSILYLGYVNGASEGIIISCAMLLASFWWGNDIWRQMISIPYCTFQLPLIRILIFGIFGLFCIFVLPFSLAHIWKAKRKVISPLLQLVPFCFYLWTLFFWTSQSEAGILGDSASQLCFFLFVCCNGIVFSKWVTLMNLNHLLCEPFPLVIWEILPLIVFPFALAKYPKIFGPLQMPFLIGYLGLVSVDYLCWSFWVVRSFCEHLKIKCFSINPTSATVSNNDKLLKINSKRHTKQE